MSERTVGVIGARSVIGQYLLQDLQDSSARVVAYTRRSGQSQDSRIAWRRFSSGIEPSVKARPEVIREWIIAAPIWVLPEHFELLAATGARRLVAVSSTSRFAKLQSSDPEEQRVAARLAQGELALEEWSARNEVDWIVLRPTLIYGGGGDKNITTAARFILRFGFYPIVGAGSGLRQPVHAADVAKACILALDARHLAQRAYNVSGAATLTYKEMITEVFRVLRREPRFVRVPSALVSGAVAILRLLPNFRHLTAAMGDRMDQDLVFDNRSATADFGFSSRPYRLTIEDLVSPF